MARNAFRVGLREDTPLPFATARSGPGVTQELDPSDILEVQDMAEAIARAEKLVTGPLRPSQTLLPPASPPSSGDIFEALGRRPTDDTAGPATPAPAGLLTPIPPAFSTPVIGLSASPASLASPAATPRSTPRYVTMPSAPTALEDDAFYHPLGRMRSLADQTLDGYRPEPTLLVRAASRRKRFSWLFVAALLPLLVLAGIAIFANADPSSPIVSSPRTPSIEAPSKLPLATTSASKLAPHTTAAEPAAKAPPAAAGTPVFDVNNLPSAGNRKR